MRCQTDDRLGRTNDQSENSSIVKVIHRTENYLDKFCIWLNERYFQDKTCSTNNAHPDDTLTFFYLVSYFNTQLLNIFYSAL